MKSQIDLLKSEAEANYSASRWEDSAKTYEHLVSLAQNNNDFEQAIAFALAAIKAWSKIPEKKNRINKLYQAVGLISLKKATIGFEELASSLETQKDMQAAALNYEEAGDGYSIIQNFDQAKKCFEKALEMFQNFSNQALKNAEFETAIHDFDHTVNLSVKLMNTIDRLLLDRRDFDVKVKQLIASEKKGLEKTIFTSKKNIAVSHEKLADSYLSKKDPDAKLIAKKEYGTAVSILESIGELQEAKKVKGKLEKL